MRDITLTGYSKREFGRLKKSKKAPASCYLCKRGAADKGIYLLGQRGSIAAYANPLSLEEISTISAKFGENIKFKFLICYECQLLLEALLEKFEFGKVMSAGGAK